MWRYGKFLRKIYPIGITKYLWAISQPRIVSLQVLAIIYEARIIDVEISDIDPRI